MNEIKNVTVIGAGTMGAGIAAHLANAGVNVRLLDIVPDSQGDRNAIANGAIQRMLKAELASDPLNAGFMDKRNARRIMAGNIEDDLADAVTGADWIIEVVKEDVAIKQSLYADIEKHRKPGTIVSSNTSTIPLEVLTQERSDDFRQHFAITHFFNPPRIMRLLELLGGPDTKPDVVSALRDFCDRRLGKQVIGCNDRPGFIANRIGTYFLSRAIFEAQDRHLKIEEVDAVLSRPFGMPKTGVFGLLDMVGVQIVPLVTKSLKDNLPADDAFVQQYREPLLVNEMLADGRWGRNSGKGGFYRMQKQSDGSKVKEAIDLKTGEYRMAERPKLKAVEAGKKGPRAVFEAGDETAAYAWSVMRDTLLYAGSLVPDVTDNIADIDAAMRAGYDWKYGPFELLDKIGVEFFVDRARRDGCAIPPMLEIAARHGDAFYEIINGEPHRAALSETGDGLGYELIRKPEGVLSLTDIKRNRKPILTNPSASVWDIGDGVVCLEFHSKMNTFDPLILQMINDTVDMMNRAPKQHKALVIYNEGAHFSFGANLGLAEMFLRAANGPFMRSIGLSGLIRKGLHSFIGELIFQGQAAFKALREAPFPVIGAPNGMALGGGCEVLLHCDAIQAGAESYIGLVEAGVGIIPGWGGNVRYLERAMERKGQRAGPMPALTDAAMAIMMPQLSVSTSAQDAKGKLWLRPHDGITMNRDRLLADAKAKALEMAPGYKPPQPGLFRLPGPSGKGALRMAIDRFYFKGGDPDKGGTTHYDVVVGEALGHALTGGDRLEENDIAAHTNLNPAAMQGRNLTINPSVALTENRMLQMERDGFMALIKRPETERRIGHMLATNKPYREPAPYPRPSPADMRQSFEIAATERRNPTGQPAEGRDRVNLDRLALATRIAYRLFPQLAR